MLHGDRCPRCACVLKLSVRGIFTGPLRPSIRATVFTAGERCIRQAAQAGHIPRPRAHDAMYPSTQVPLPGVYVRLETA